MRFFDIVVLALKNLWRRKVRTLLTVIGVIIGTASIVVMLSLGIGMDESFKKQVSSMGSLNIINVDPYYVPDNAKEESAQPTQTKLDDKAITAISNIEGVEAVTPILQAGLKIVSGKYLCYGNIIGMDLEAMKTMDFKALDGRLLEKGDTNGLVFGFYIPQQFYNPKVMNMDGGMPSGDGKPPVDVLKDKIQLTFDMNYGEKKVLGAIPDSDGNKPPKFYKAKGIGILAESKDEKDYSIYMDINQLKALMMDDKRQQKGRATLNAQDGYQRAIVKVKDIDKVDEVQKKIKDMQFGAYSLAGIRSSMQKTSKTMQAVLGGIGAVSFLVAALGITNTMIMSIYERTREIGIMKVIGCLLSDIRKIFLWEAGLIGFLGGLAGVGLSFAASYILNHLKSDPSQMGGILPITEEQGSISVIPVWLSASSILFATMIGLIAGLYPAIRAMRLSSLEAMRSE